MKNQGKRLCFIKIFIVIIIPNESIAAFLQEINENLKLNNDDRNILDKLSSYKECRGAVNKKKSPGLDGLPSEFYQCLWGIIVHFFLQSYLKYIKEVKCHTLENYL